VNEQLVRPLVLQLAIGTATTALHTLRTFSIRTTSSAATAVACS